MQLTCDEIVNILDVRYVAGSTNGYTLSPSVFEISDLNFILKNLLPDEVKVNITIDDIRLKSNLTTKKNKWVQKKIFSLYCFRFCWIALGSIR